MATDERRRKRRKGKGELGVMDTAREGFVRHVALDQWREYEALRETLGDARQALVEAGLFLGRRAYRPLWEGIWRERVVQAMPALDAQLFGVIEDAVAEAFQQELALRDARGDRPIEEDPDYRAFLGRTLGSLSREGAGGLLPPEAEP